MFEDPWNRMMPDHQQTRATETICVPVAEANCPDSLKPASAVAEWATRFLTIPGIQKKKGTRINCRGNALSLKMVILTGME